MSRVAPALRRARDELRASRAAEMLSHVSDLALASSRRLLGASVVRVSVVIPTVGRPTLQRAVESAAWGDEVIVVYDAATLPVAVPSGAIVLHCGPTGHYGAEQRHLGIARATGTHLAFLDDDDVHTPEAGTAIRRALAARPGRVHVFRMRDADREYGGHGCVVQGSIGSPMFVVPNDGRLGEWSTRYEGDFDFIHSTLEARGQRPRFHSEVVALVRPGE